MMQRLFLAWILATGAALTLIGCHVESDNHGDGKNVRIDTPFGNMRVKTDSSDVLGGIGLPGYPGATQVQEDGDHSKGSADVNMSFGRFQLRVKAASYRTTDSPEKVRDFYRKALNRYGDVIQCKAGQPVGSPTHTSEGLTCSNNENSGDDHDALYKLKAGSRQHQHIVAINADGSGTRFGLVALDLPGNLHFDKDDDEHKQ